MSMNKNLETLDTVICQKQFTNGVLGNSCNDIIARKFSRAQKLILYG